MAKQRTTHIRDPYIVETTGGFNGRFRLTVRDEKHNIVFHLDRSDIHCIARALWKVLRTEKQAIENVCQSMQGDE